MMTFFSKRKRKNDNPPRFPAWILVLVAIGAVIIVEILFQPTSRNTGESSVQVAFPTVDEPLLLTATAIIKQATALAQGTPQPPVVVGADNLDLFQVTATYLVEQATALAQGTPKEALNLNAIEMTATYIVKQATLQAGTPSS
jgi:hypothetical protein